MIEDSELGVLYRKEVERMGDEKAAVAGVRKKFIDEICHSSRGTELYQAELGRRVWCADPHSDGSDVLAWLTSI